MGFKIILGTIILIFMVISAVLIYTKRQEVGTALEKECCSECVMVTSAVPGHDANDRCSVFNEGYLSLPYKLSDKCKAYFKDNGVKISECLKANK